MRPKKGRSFVLAVDFVVSDANKDDIQFLKNRKALIEKVVNYLLLLIDTHDKVSYPYIKLDFTSVTFYHCARF